MNQITDLVTLLPFVYISGALSLRYWAGRWWRSLGSLWLSIFRITYLLFATTFCFV